jgi:hypothetical protein
MIRLFAERLLLVCIGGLLAMGALQQVDPTPPPLLVRADYPVCVTVRPPSLLRSPQHRVDYRADPNAFNDKGII